MIIEKCEQGSDEWYKMRIGSIGGSSIGAVCAKGQGKMRTALLYRLAGEILSGEKYVGYKNAYMEYGIETEEEAKKLYSFINDVEIENVGLIKLEPHKHCSPDALVGDDGLIEVKCVIPSVHVEYICTDVVPAEYRKQVQWNLFISGRKWADFVSYCPLITDKMMFVKRTERDEKLIREMNTEADRFIGELLAIINKIKAMQ